MKRWLTLLVFFPALVVAQPAPEQARADRLYAEVRCVQCQSQSIADSDAPIAVDMRARIRAEIAAGRTDTQIREGLRARYGDYVLFRPRLKGSTVWLWVLPGLVLLMGLGGLWWLRRQQTVVPDSDLTPEEMARIQALVKD